MGTSRSQSFPVTTLASLLTSRLIDRIQHSIVAFLLHFAQAFSRSRPSLASIDLNSSLSPLSRSPALQAVSLIPRALQPTGPLPSRSSQAPTLRSLLTSRLRYPAPHLDDFDLLQHD